MRKAERRKNAIIWVFPSKPFSKSTPKEGRLADLGSAAANCATSFAQGAYRSSIASPWPYQAVAANRSKLMRSIGK